MGDKTNLFLKVNTSLGLYHVVFTTPKTFLEKHTLTVIEMQQLGDFEDTNSVEEFFRLKWTIYNGRKTVYVKIKTDTDNLNIVVYR